LTKSLANLTSDKIEEVTNMATKATGDASKAIEDVQNGDVDNSKQSEKEGKEVLKK
jgi:hypothetical protein